MVSVDHFRQELRSQMVRAFNVGQIDITISSGELCRSISRENVQTVYSCDAMQEEMKPGDFLILDRTNGAGMTIRYLLPRAN